MKAIELIRKFFNICIQIIIVHNTLYITDTAWKSYRRRIQFLKRKRIENDKLYMEPYIMYLSNHVYTDLERRLKIFMYKTALIKSTNTQTTT